MDYFKRCVLCGWPINREIEERVLRNYLELIKKWLEEKGANKLASNLESSVENMVNGGLNICRYDFFDYIKALIEKFSPVLGKKFKKEFVDKFDFKGSIIT